MLRCGLGVIFGSTGNDEDMELCFCIFITKATFSDVPKTVFTAHAKALFEAALVYVKMS